MLLSQSPLVEHTQPGAPGQFDGASRSTTSWSVTAVSESSLSTAATVSLPGSRSGSLPSAAATVSAAMPPIVPASPSTTEPLPTAPAFSSGASPHAASSSPTPASAQRDSERSDGPPLWRSRRWSRQALVLKLVTPRTWPVCRRLKLDIASAAVQLPAPLVVADRVISPAADDRQTCLWTVWKGRAGPATGCWQVADRLAGLLGPRGGGRGAAVRRLCPQPGADVKS